MELFQKDNLGNKDRVISIEELELEESDDKFINLANACRVAKYLVENEVKIVETPEDYSVEYSYYEDF